ncbi:DUF349 domain-containing protein [Salibacter halophilus]|uniref:DUF349 domain-containing protein n=1 Tax=Salibacter halophilus TaxID=1803916 RepID=A0A6N6MAJ4_9FLAO|nr:DUF349 domain-containing protein [Salibacter halophilus]KAB1066272.1 DUF349 domain-containing protein [Salibacter halophilus]
MTKADLNKQLEELLEKEMNNETAISAKDILANYQTLAAADHKTQLEEHLEKGGKKEEFSPKRDDEDEHFDELWAKFSQKKKTWEKELADVQQENYKHKLNIIDEIKDLTENEENVKRAFERMRELEEKWKELGSVPSQKFRELQNKYSRMRDEFFYNMRIYKELLEHDLKRNLQKKEELAEKMESLKEKKNIKEVDTLLKTYLKEWDEIGPTFREEWEKVRDRFRSAQHELFDKIKQHYQQVKDQHLENLERKKKLVDQLEKINEEEIETQKRWRKLTEKVKDLQKEWKTIGFAPKEENREVWERFQKAGDDFFEAKREYFANLKVEQDKNKSLKEEMIKEAQALEDSEDWKETKEKLIKLQKRWQKVGNAHQRDEQRLWKTFRSSCNKFFDRKKDYFANKDQREAENLEKKKAIIEKIEKFEPAGDYKKDLESLEDLTHEFNEVGFIPINQKSLIANAYRKAVREQYKKLGLDEEETKERLYKNKLEDLSHSSNSDRVLEREERKIRENISKLKSTLNRYETNISFVESSKGGESLLKDVKDKIESTRKQLENEEKKLDMLYRTQEDDEEDESVSEEETEN